MTIGVERGLAILAVGMLDVAVMRRDAFFVQVAPGRVRHWFVHADGRREPAPDADLTYDDVLAAVERYGHGYLCDEPVPVPALDELPRMLGRFEITSATTCRLRDDA